MKTAMTGLILAIIMAAPISFAQDTSADTHAISIWDIRFRQVGQAFGDFAFNIKAALTFDENAKVELLKERNAQMKARQRAWLETKAAAMENFAELSADEKKEVLSALKSEHEAIIKEHLRLGMDIRSVQLKAKAVHRADIEEHAESAAEDEEKSGLSLGLGLDTATYGSAGNFTTEQARALASARFGVDGTVTTQEKNGQTFYVVSGEKTETAGSYELTRDYAIWINSSTGVVATVDMSAHLEAAQAAATLASASENNANEEELEVGVQI